VAAFAVIIVAGTALLAGICIAGWWIAVAPHVERRRRIVTLTKAQIRWRADYEDWLWTHGYTAGIYGRYTPYV
jgi:hypothetical protein